MSSQSMTGFGKGETETKNYRLSVELKSVNHRFKDMRFKMGSIFNQHEISLRKKLETQFKRGSFDVFINYKKTYTDELKVELDYTKINNFIATMKKEIQSDVSITINPTDFLRNDFYVEDTSREDELLGMLDGAFESAVSALAASRHEEGAKLVNALREHQAVFEGHYLKIVGLKDCYQESVKDKLTKRFESDAKELNLDEPRFLQEIIYYLEKLDIEEETSRIKIHLAKLSSVLSEGTEEVGRQIDFLVQELNRETNTIGSKSGAGEISDNVVQMKVQLEKIREQALNLQ